MAWYAVSYDLRKEHSPEVWARTHKGLWDLAGDAYCWPLSSFWIIRSGLTAGAIIQHLLGARAIDEKDGIIVLQLTRVGDFRGIVDEGSAEWLNTLLLRS